MTDHNDRDCQIDETSALLTLINRYVAAQLSSSSSPPAVEQVDLRTLDERHPLRLGVLACFEQGERTAQVAARYPQLTRRSIAAYLAHYTRGTYRSK